MSIRKLSILVGLGCTSLFADNYGVINMQQAIMTSNAGVAARNKMQKEIDQKKNEFAKKEANINKMAEELKKFEQQIQSQQAVMSEMEKSKKIKEFQEKYKKLQDEDMALKKSQEDFREFIRKNEMEESQKLYQELAKEAQEEAKKQNLDLVLEQSSGVIVFMKKYVDITEEVIKRHNNLKPTETTKLRGGKAAADITPKDKIKAAQSPTKSAETPHLRGGSVSDAANLAKEEVIAKSSPEEKITAVAAETSPVVSPEATPNQE